MIDKTTLLQNSKLKETILTEARVGRIPARLTIQTNISITSLAFENTTVGN